MEHLKSILCRPIQANTRTHRYQSVIDNYIDSAKERWELDRGLMGAKGIDLPHEQHTDFWQLDEQKRQSLTSDDAARIYHLNGGRGGTHYLGVFGFAWHSPLSRHQGDDYLLVYFERSLEFYLSTLHEDGTPALYGLNGLDWAHGWDIEGVIYGLVYFSDAMDQALKSRAMEKLRTSAARFMSIGTAGTHGNQGCVHVLGLYLYGHLLDIPEAVSASDKRWADLAPRTLDESGQVVEQYGPCMHYSYTCFIYAWLNAFIRGGDGQEERIARCLRWFRYKHTESLYPFPGPSSRQYYEKIRGKKVDVIPACEQLATTDPMFQEFTDRFWDKLEGAGGGGHGASPLMWAILACPGEIPQEERHRKAWNEPFEEYYERILLIGRSPLKYMLVRRRYQTSYNVRDFLPFSGIQTWAWEDEPPIIHPTMLYPSTTRAEGIDTAKQGVSQNWGLFGAGAMVTDYKYRLATDKGEPSIAVARYDSLWRVVVFTDVSTVILEFGRTGPRTTLWTLNRLEPAEPSMSDGCVTFAGRQARMFTNLEAPEEIVAPSHDDENDSTILKFSSDGEAAIFAFSNHSFSIIRSLTNAGEVVFQDDSGKYELKLAPGFFDEDNPGNFTLNRQELLDATSLCRI